MDYWELIVDEVEQKYCFSHIELANLMCVDERSVRNWVTDKSKPNKIHQVILLTLADTDCDVKKVQRHSMARWIRTFVLNFIKRK